MKDMLKNHQVVSEAEWIKARQELLLKEKRFTRLQAELNEARRSLPWVKVTKEYLFDGAGGKSSLADLFAGRSQLVIYHFMFTPDDQAGCRHCSLRADGFNGIHVHLQHRDVTLMAVSRAPYKKLAAYQKRMGWTFKWVSSGDTDFNHDYYVSFTKEAIAKGEAFFNYALQDPGHPEREGHSVFY